MWNGERCEPEAVPVIATYEDHRMAMAFAPAVITFPKLLIADASCFQIVSRLLGGFETCRIPSDKRRLIIVVLWKISINILPISTIPLL